MLSHLAKVSVLINAFVKVGVKNCWRNDTHLLRDSKDFKDLIHYFYSLISVQTLEQVEVMSVSFILDSRIMECKKLTPVYAVVTLGKVDGDIDLSL